MLPRTLLALAASLTAVQAVSKGFNYGSTFTDGTVKTQSDYVAEFNAAKNLVGTSGFTSARLYTMIQGGTDNTPIAAIPAAIETNTTLLLGLWASESQEAFNQELSALDQAITNYGTAFTDLVVGISVGSEDLYRISPTGIENDSGVGAEPSTIATFIGEVRQLIANTAAASIPVGHVDTWTAWVNASNNAVIEACDFIGFDGYPYFQNTQANSIANAKSLFYDAYQQTVAAVGSKPVWITETGWPISGPQENEGVASVENAQTYWDEVGCDIFNNLNTWWYTLQDAYPTTPSPSFGILGASLDPSSPAYNLTCPAGTNGASSGSDADSSASSATSASATTSAAASATSASSAVSSSPSPASSKATQATSSAQAQAATSAQASVPTTQTATSFSTVIKTSSGAAATSAAGSSSSSSGSGSGSSSGSCPANLDGTFEFPHLIIPIDSAHPTTAYGTQYNGTVSGTVSSLFLFDIPASTAGQTCSLVFLLPEHSALTTSAYTLSAPAGSALVASQLAAVPNAATDYANAPAVSASLANVTDVKEDGAWVLASGACPAGQAVGYELSSQGGLALEWFEDYGDSLGLYVRVC